VFDHKPSASLESVGSSTPVYHPGDEISITYTEPILCQYHEVPGQVNVNGWFGPTIPGLLTAIAANTTGTQQMIYQCSDHQVQIDFRSPDWSVLQGQYVAVQVTGVIDLAHNPFPPSSADQQLIFKVASFNVNSSLAYVTGLTFTSPPANLVYQMNNAPAVGSSSSSSSGAVRVSSSSSSTGAGHRRLLQVDGLSSSSTGPMMASSTGIAINETNPANDTSVVSTELYDWLLQPYDATVVREELMSELIAVINMQMGAVNARVISGVNPSGLDPSQLNITSLGAGVMRADIAILPCSTPSCSSISPSSASHFLFEGLMNDALIPLFLDVSTFPFLSNLVFPSDQATPTTSGTFGMSSPMIQISVDAIGYAAGEAPVESTSSTSQSSSSGGVSGGAIAGIVIGGVVGLCALMALLVVCSRQAKEGKEVDRGHDEVGKRVSGGTWAVSEPNSSGSTGDLSEGHPTKGEEGMRSTRPVPLSSSIHLERGGSSGQSLEISPHPLHQPGRQSPGLPAIHEGHHLLHPQHLCDAPSLHAMSSASRASSAPGGVHAVEASPASSPALSSSPRPRPVPYGQRLAVMKGDSTLTLSHVELAPSEGEEVKSAPHWQE
jgi:hypothetical protein